MISLKRINGHVQAYNSAEALLKAQIDWNEQRDEILGRLIAMLFEKGALMPSDMENLLSLDQGSLTLIATEKEAK